MNRRTFLYSLSLFGIGAGGLSACNTLLKPYLMNPCLTDLPLSSEVTTMLEKVWQGIDAQQVWDTHVHLVGTGDSTGELNLKPWLNPKMDSYLHPVLSVQKFFYINGSCVDEQQIDVSYITRLQQLLAKMPSGVKLMLFAFDWQYDEQGRIIRDNSVFHIPNRYAAKIVQTYPTLFEWVASIHPYRADCVDALQQAHAEGARAIKWLPSAMGIDPLSKRCERFYQAAAGLKMPIISHTGEENAVQGGNQDYGNPLRVRRALDAGVKVVLAHCASDGEDVDLDQGNAAARVKSYQLFARLMDESAYKSLLYADISAITLRNHAWVLKPLLARTDWHSRLLNGSDYPLVGILPLFDLADLAAENLLATGYLLPLRQLQQAHPLLFDFALKRLLQFGTARFPTTVFETRRFFDLPAA